MGPIFITLLNFLPFWVTLVRITLQQRTGKWHRLISALLVIQTERSTSRYGRAGGDCLAPVRYCERIRVLQCFKKKAEALLLFQRPCLLLPRSLSRSLSLWICHLPPASSSPALGVCPQWEGDTTAIMSERERGREFVFWTPSAQSRSVVLTHAVADWE